MGDLVSTIDLGSQIIQIRGHSVVLADQLAEFLETDTRSVNQHRSRNPERFSEPFAFQLTKDEWAALKSRNVISKGRGGARYRPWAYTEHGALMMAIAIKTERGNELARVLVDTFVRYRNGTLPRKTINTESSSNDRVRTLRFKIMERIEQLLTSQLPYEGGRTVGEELNEVARGAMASIKAMVENPARKDEMASAEIAKVIAEAEQIYANVRLINEETKGVGLTNLQKEIEIVHQLHEMAQQLERDEASGALDSMFGRRPLKAIEGKAVPE